MLRLPFLVLASTLAFCSIAQVSSTDTATSPVADNALKVVSLDPLLNQDEALLEAKLPRFTDLEYQIIETTGLLSLSQQVKYTAKRLINQSAGHVDASKSTENRIEINHAQHFSIAKSLSVHWAQDIWQQRLLEIIDGRTEETQALILQQLQHPSLQAAQRREKEAISAQNTVQYEQYMTKLRQQPPAAARWKLVEDIDQKSGFSKMIIQVREAVIQEISLQVKGWKAPKNWKSDVRKEVVEFLFYAYRTTPNQELRQIIYNFKQPELRRFYRDVRQEISKR